MAAIVITILWKRKLIGREITYSAHRHMVINSHSSTRKSSSTSNLKCFPLILAFILLLKAHQYFILVSFTDFSTALPSSLRYTKMKTATNIYIFNLALADALATSTLPFQSVNYLMGTWPFGTILCKIVISIDYYNMFTSIFTLCTMSVDRYIAVCHPVKALDFRTPRNAKIINVCNWILSSAIGLPVMFMATTKYRHGEQSRSPEGGEFMDRCVGEVRSQAEFTERSDVLVKL